MDPVLYKAVVSGNLSYFESLSNNDRHKFLQVTTDQQNTILHVAAKCRKKHIAEKIIDSCPSLVHETDAKGDSPLHIAARLGHLGIAKLLINQAKVAEEVEAEKNLLRMVNLKGDTALHMSVKNGHIEVVKLLVDEDQILTTITNNAGESPLFIAVERNFYEIAIHILTSSPTCAYRGRNGMNVWHAVIIQEQKNNRHRKFLYELLRRNSSTIAEADNFGWVPLHYAAYLGNSQAVELLLDMDISLADAKDGEGMSALHIAAKTGQNDVIRKLIKKCPHITELLDNNRRTALHIAAERGNRSTVLMLLSLPIFNDLINAQDVDGNTPFHLAVLQEHRNAALDLAINPRIDKWAINNEGFNPFDIAKSKNLLLPQGVKSLECSMSRKTREVKSSEMQRLQTENPTEQPKEKTPSKMAKEISNIILVIATIIASVTFTAAITMPGGYNSDSNKHAGMAILSRKAAFGVFVIANTIAFSSSATLMVLPFLTLKKVYDSAVKVLAWCASVMILSIYSMIIAFLAGSYAVLGSSPSLGIAAIVVGIVSFYAILIPIERAML